MVSVKVNCVFNDQGVLCNHAKVKKSLFARYCTVYPYETETCEYRERKPRPRFTPKGQGEIK